MEFSPVGKLGLDLVPSSDFGGKAMPMYDYKCQDCGKEFHLALSLKDHESGAAKCPSCGSKKLEQEITGFVAKTSRKS